MSYLHGGKMYCFVEYQLLIKADIEKYGACKACEGPKYSDYDGYCSVCHLLKQGLADMAKNKENPNG